MHLNLASSCMEETSIPFFAGNLQLCVSRGCISCCQVVLADRSGASPHLPRAAGLSGSRLQSSAQTEACDCLCS